MEDINKKLYTSKYLIDTVHKVIYTINNYEDYFVSFAKRNYIIVLVSKIIDSEIVEAQKSIFELRSIYEQPISIKEILYLNKLKNDTSTKNIENETIKAQLDLQNISNTMGSDFQQTFERPNEFQFELRNNEVEKYKEAINNLKQEIDFLKKEKEMMVTKELSYDSAIAELKTKIDELKPVKSEVNDLKNSYATVDDLKEITHEIKEELLSQIKTNISNHLDTEIKTKSSDDALLKEFAKNSNATENLNDLIKKLFIEKVNDKTKEEGISFKEAISDLKNELKGEIEKLRSSSNENKSETTDFATIDDLKEITSEIKQELFEKLQTPSPHFKQEKSNTNNEELKDLIKQMFVEKVNEKTKSEGITFKEAISDLKNEFKNKIDELKVSSNLEKNFNKDEYATFDDLKEITKELKQEFSNQLNTAFTDLKKAEESHSLINKNINNESEQIKGETLINVIKEVKGIIKKDK